MRKNLLRRILAASVALGSFTFTPNFYDFNFMPVAFAQVETYEGVGEYIMSKKETPEFAEKSAKGYALQNAQAQAGFFLKNLSIVKNNHLEEEMMVVSANIVREIESVPVLIPLSSADSGYIKCRVTVKVQIDTDELKTEIDKLLKRDTNERADLVKKNELLQKMLDDANKRNAELEKLIANAKTDDDKKIIDSEVSMVTNDAQVIEKVAEGNKNLYDNNKEAAEKNYSDSTKIKFYEGVGVWLQDASMPVEFATNRAKERALRAATERAGIFIQSISKKNDAGLTESQIIVFSKINLKIENCTITKEFIPNEDVIKYTCHVKVSIDTAELDKQITNLKNEGK